MFVALVVSHWGPYTLGVRRIESAQLAATRVFGDHVVLESIGKEAEGKYRITMPDLECGEFADANGRHTVWIDEVPPQRPGPAAGQA